MQKLILGFILFLAGILGDRAMATHTPEELSIPIIDKAANTEYRTATFGLG